MSDNNPETATTGTPSSSSDVSPSSTAAAEISSFVAMLRESDDTGTDNIDADVGEENGHGDEDSPTPPAPTPIEESKKAHNERAARRAMKEAAALRAELDRAKAELATVKGDKWAAIGGVEGAEALIKDILDNKIPGAPLTPEQEKERDIREMKEQLAAIREREEQLQSEKIEQRNLEVIGERLSAHAEEFPVLGAVGERWAKKEALRRGKAHYEKTGEAPDLREIFAEMNEDILQDAAPFFDDERALRSLLSDPARRERVMKILSPTTRSTSIPKKTITSNDRSENRSRLDNTVIDNERHEQKLLEYARKLRASDAGF